MMKTKMFLWLLWAIFIAYTLLLAPLDQPGTLTVIEKLLKLQLEGINPYLVALFALMGVWPMVYACLLFIDERTQNISAGPALIASNGAGIIGLIPYLLLRQPQPHFSGRKDMLIKISDSRWTGIVLLLSTIWLLAWAWLNGDWGDYVRQWQSISFVHLITWDFCLMAVIFPSVLGDDMARRGLSDDRIFWAVSLVPLLGPLVYLCLRPPLPESATEIPTFPLTAQN